MMEAFGGHSREFRFHSIGVGKPWGHGSEWRCRVWGVT